MLQARIIHADGSSTLAGADELDKAAFHDLAAEGRLLCPDCAAPMVHVAAHRADGGSLRVAHFRSHAVEDHDPACLYRDDPHESNAVTTFKRALRDGTPILVNINMDPAVLGFRGLRSRFNAQVNNPQTGLFSKKHWVATTGAAGYLNAPAHDISDIIHYLEMAKEAGGQEAMGRLWFNTSGAVQSCARFVVADRASKLGALLGQMVGNARASKNSAGEVMDTPRLFRFRASTAQVNGAAKGKTAKALHLLWGERVEIETPTSHIIIPGLRLKGPEGTALDKRAVLNDGHELWVLAAPSLARARAHEIAAKADGRRLARVEPAFMLLPVHDRGQFVATGKIAADARNGAANAPRPSAP